MEFRLVNTNFETQIPCDGLYLVLLMSKENRMGRKLNTINFINSITQRDHGTNQPFLKARVLGTVCGLSWWRKSEKPEKNPLTLEGRNATCLFITCISNPGCSGGKRVFDQSAIQLVPVSSLTTAVYSDYLSYLMWKSSFMDEVFKPGKVCK